MKILIVSDTHDNLPNFKKAIGWAVKDGVQTLIHCGDVCSPDTWHKALKNFKGKRFLSLGNADKGYGWQSSENIFNDFGSFRFGEQEIAFCHFPDKARELAETGKYNFVFYGHTHKPWAERVDRCELVNPGNLAGIIYKPTFTIYDTNTNALSLKILDRLK